MSSFGCAFRLTFILCSLMAVFFGGLVLVLVVARWAGVAELLGALPGGGAVVAGTGAAGAVTAAVALALRRGRGG